MAGDLYCGKCHTWMYPLHRAAGGFIWMCECPLGQADMRKDPNCHNNLHEHHDPQSPIVLSRKAEYEAEEALLDQVIEEDAEAMPTGVYSAADGGPDNEGTICGHERLDGRCNFWGCPVRRAEAVAHVVHNGSPCETCGALITDEPKRPLADRVSELEVRLYDAGTICTCKVWHLADCWHWGNWHPDKQEWIGKDCRKCHAVCMFARTALKTFIEAQEETRSELAAILRETNEEVED